MRKVLFWFTVISGVGAAYLMLKRGAPLSQIAQEATSHPVGALTNELKAIV